jgi:hypothetical protein
MNEENRKNRREEKIEEQNKKIEEQEHKIEELEKKDEDSCIMSFTLPILGGIIHSPETPYQNLCVVNICVCILLISCLYSLLQHYVSAYLIDDTD